MGGKRDFSPQMSKESGARKMSEVGGHARGDWETDHLEEIIFACELEFESHGLKKRGCGLY